MRPRNPHARAIIAPVTVTKVVDKIVAWHGICLACGRTMRTRTWYQLACDYRCRQLLYRRRKRQREQAQEQEEELRLDRAEQALRRRRLGLGRTRPVRLGQRQG